MGITVATLAIKIVHGDTDKITSEPWEYETGKHAIRATLSGAPAIITLDTTERGARDSDNATGILAIQWRDVNGNVRDCKRYAVAIRGRLTLLAGPADQLPACDIAALDCIEDLSTQASADQAYFASIPGAIPARVAATLAQEVAAPNAAYHARLASLAPVNAGIYGVLDIEELPAGGDFTDNVRAGKMDAPCIHCGAYQDAHGIQDLACPIASAAQDRLAREDESEYAYWASERVAWDSYLARLFPNHVIAVDTRHYAREDARAPRRLVCKECAPVALTARDQRIAARVADTRDLPLIAACQYQTAPAVPYVAAPYSEPVRAANTRVIADREIKPRIDREAQAAPDAATRRARIIDAIREYNASAGRLATQYGAVNAVKRLCRAYLDHPVADQPSAFIRETMDRAVWSAVKIARAMDCAGILG